MADKKENSEKINIFINGKKCSVAKDGTILDALKMNGVKVPTLCYHSDLKIKANCRVCAVEIKGRRDLATSCSEKVKEGMEITTNSERVKRARRINLELLFSQHKEECSDCIWGFDCKLLALAKEYGVKITKFHDRKQNYPVYKFGPSLIYDSSKCIDCKNCVEMCSRQGVNFLEVKKRGDFNEVVPSTDAKKDCIYCGQCAVHCPAGAFEAVGEFEDVEKCLNLKGKKVIFQFAPAVRSSIGEEFGMPLGFVATGKIVGAVKKLGAYKVFDTCVGADFTTYEEADEIIERIKEDKTPCLSSCCPAWVKFVEFNYPEFIPNIATTRSPHIIIGGLIKTYFAKKEKINPKDIIVVSVMPCVSKKYEIERKQILIGGIKPVDYVMTVRELAYLLTKRGIDLKKVKGEKADDPFGIPSGAGVIYGASGGVMESVLRTAYSKITGKKPVKLEFEQIRGLQGAKKATIDINGVILKMAVVNGIGQAKKILEELKKNPKAYHGVEVMACLGGCIGGGGQPVPTDACIREARAKSLYKIDDKFKLRLAEENPAVKKVYKEFLTSKEIRHKICHTSYSRKNKEVNFKKYGKNK
jgi:NADP-reducing hydrogenase subunit HndD